MSNDLRDVFKTELDQIPLRPAETWVPERRARPRLTAIGWRAPVAIGAAAVVLVAALVGGRQLASFRDRTAAAPGVVAGKALYLSPSFNGSGWIQIDPDDLKDVSPKPLLDIAPSSTNSSQVHISPDGSTIVVSDFSAGSRQQTVYDGRTGQPRGFFIPEVAMGIESLSGDGTLALGRLGNNPSPVTAERVIVTVADGRVVRRIPAAGDIGAVQAWPVSPDLGAIYYLVTAAPVNLNSAVPQTLPYSLVVQSTVTGAVSPPVPLPDITAGTIITGPASALRTLSVRPAIALSPDGSRLAALSADGRTLVMVDTRTLAVSSVTIRRSSSLLDLFRPLVAEAKTVNDEQRQAMAFTPDGSSIISFITETRYDEITGATRTTRGLQRVEIATGLITADTFFTDGIYGLALLPDGRSIYLVVRAKEPPTPVYLLRRLDARTLELKAERGIPDYAELTVLAAPAPRAAVSTPTPPSRTQPTASCDHDRLVYLVEQFFARYNAHQAADLLTLFNLDALAVGGGFADYVDDPGVPVQIRQPGKLLSYWEQRFAAGERLEGPRIDYPPEGATRETGNPTAMFTRSFSGGTQQGNMKLVCNAGRLVAVTMSSDYAGWGSRNAFGARFSVPSSWKGPEDLQTQKDAGAPKHWLVFTDPAGNTPVTVWLWEAASTDEVARTRLAAPGSARRSLTITDAGQSRDVIEIHAGASWSGPTGSGTYDNRHLLVQLTPSLVADVIVSAPRINGASELTAEQLQLQDRITVRIAASGGSVN